MTREEAINNLNMISVAFVEAETKEQRKIIDDTFNMAIKALEQEPILDKIRAEIDKARFVDKDTRICKNALASGLEAAMQIIDKYKAESEDKE